MAHPALPKGADEPEAVMSENPLAPPQIPAQPEPQTSEQLEQKSADRPDTARTKPDMPVFLEPVAPEITKTQINIQSGAHAALFSQEKSFSPRECIAELKKLRQAGAYREGAGRARDIYKEFEEHGLQDDWLLDVVDLGGWMQYSSEGDDDRACFTFWRDRAVAIYERKSEERREIERAIGADLNLRKNLIIAELAMKLQQIRMEWKLVLNHEHDSAIKQRLAGEAITQCNLILQQDILLRTVRPDSKPRDRDMAAILEQSVEYGALIAEANRMKGVMIGASWRYDPKYRALDKDNAERNMYGSHAFVEILKSSDAFLQRFMNFYLDEHPGLPTPPFFYYAVYQLVRNLKMSGQYAKAFKHALNLREKVEQDGDKLFVSRMSNFTGELFTILADRLIVLKSGDEKNLLWQEARTMLKIAGMSEEKIKALEPKEIVFQLLQYADQESYKAFYKTNDVPQKRVVQPTGLDAALTRISAGEDSWLIEMGRVNPRRYILKELARFDESLLYKRDEREEILRDHEDCPEMNLDEQWFFGEAPLLARLYVEGKHRGLTLDIFAKIPRRHFEGALPQLKEEFANRKDGLPDEYYKALEVKIKNLEALLGSGAA